MKHLILLIALGSVWGCSGDPKQQGSRDQSPGQADSQASAEGMSSGNNGSGNETVAVHTDPVVAKGNETTSEPATESGKAATVPPVATGPNPEEDTTVTPPHKVTGAYLVGTVLPHKEGETIKIGLVVKAEDKRLSMEPARYGTIWSLASELDDPSRMKLAKSLDENFDRVLEFEGTEEEFASLQSSIAVQVNVLEIGEVSTLHSVIMNSLSELLAPAP